ncbi:MAG TPA: hypothetical protein VMT27_02135 [Actinomycetes bacterium]|nr:hypothetical protein [Actinomycetes bacterium]
MASATGLTGALLGPLLFAPVPARAWVTEQTTMQTSGGTALTFGANARGQLGDGSSATTVRATPATVTGLDDIVDLSGGREHAIALRSDGTVVTWGSDEFGQLGNGDADNADHFEPIDVPGLSGIVDVDDGHYHSIALKDDGTVWAWGFGSLGQLGTGATPTRVQSPVQFGTISSAKAVFGGRDMTLVLLDDGTVWCAGSNASGECGPGAAEPKTPSPIQVSGLSDIVDLAGGRNHAVALKSDGTVWTWGLNDEGQLGDGTQTSHSDPRQVAGLTDVVDVGAGADHSLAVTAAGSVYAWGWGARGQLGLGDESNRLIPTQVPGIDNAASIDAGRDHSLVITDQGSLITWGENADEQTGSTGALEVLSPFVVPGLANVVAAAGGQAYTVVLQGSTSQSDVVFQDGFDQGLADWSGGGNFALDANRVPSGGLTPSLRAALTHQRASATHQGLPTVIGPEVCATVDTRVESLSTATTLLRLRADDDTPIARLIVTKARKLAVRADVAKVREVSSTKLPLRQWHALGLCTVKGSGTVPQVAISYDGTEVGRWDVDNGSQRPGKVQIGSEVRVTATVNLDDVVVTSG